MEVVVVSKKEIRIVIQQAEGLIPNINNDVSKPIIEFQMAKFQDSVYPVADNPTSEDRGPIYYNYENRFIPGHVGKLYITIRDHGIVIGTKIINCKKLTRTPLLQWYDLCPENRGRILIELTAINWGKIARPMTERTKITESGVHFISTTLRNSMRFIPSSPIKEYKKKEIKRQMPHIGQGTFGIVYKGNVKDRKAIVAIKDIKVKDPTTFEEWKKEVEFMSQNTHKYVVEIYGYYCSPEMLTIVMEYLEGGMLFDLLHENQTESMKLTMLDRLRMARHVTISVAFLHNKRVIHRDVKSMNILVGKNYICKLSDFGSAKFIIPDIYKNTAGKGTPFWMAPEVMYGHSYSFPADIYSLGIVFYELFVNKLPQYDHERKTILLESYSFLSSGIVLSMLHLTASKRPTAMNIAERIDFILRSALYHLEDNLGYDQSLDEWFIHNGYIAKPNNDIDNLIIKLLNEKFEPPKGTLPSKPNRPAPDIPNGPLTSRKTDTPSHPAFDHVHKNPSKIKIGEKHIRTIDRKSDDDSSDDEFYDREYERMKFTPNQILTLSDDYNSDDYSVKKNEKLIFLEQKESWIKVQKISNPTHKGWLNLENISFLI